MDNELINIYDKQRRSLGVATREEVHQLGYWHDTFHCWVISMEDKNASIYFQIRSHLKKDYPSLLDITAAGHILSHESIEDGIREVEEELGIPVSFNSLISIGIIDYSVTTGNFIDNEFAHCYLLKGEFDIDDFNLQEDEVSGIVKTDFESFYNFSYGHSTVLPVQGYRRDERGEKIPIKKSVNRSHMVPHKESYFEKIASKMLNELNQKNTK